MKHYKKYTYMHVHLTLRVLIQSQITQSENIDTLISLLCYACFLHAVKVSQMSKKTFITSL